MPKVNYVKAAAKDHGHIKKGQPYYWWKFRYGGKHTSLTRPRASQLTQSEFIGAVLSLQERVEDSSPSTVEDFESERDDIISELENLRDETQEKFDNVPESLQYGPTGELLQARIDSVDSVISDLQSVDVDFDADDLEKEEGEEDEDFETRKTEAEEEAVNNAWSELGDLISNVDFG